VRLRAASFLAGGLWGFVALGLGARAYGAGIWGGIAAAPFVGLAVGRLLHSRFEGAAGFGRWLVALLSLYLGATLFAIAVGLTDALSGSAARSEVEVVVQAVMGTWWGITLTGFLIALWPLAYLTHVVLEWIDDIAPERSPP
jgi:hypothetical protein